MAVLPPSLVGKTQAMLTKHSALGFERSSVVSMAKRRLPRNLNIMTLEVTVSEVLDASAHLRETRELGLARELALGLARDFALGLAPELGLPHALDRALGFGFGRPLGLELGLLADFRLAFGQDHDLGLAPEIGLDPDLDRVLGLDLGPGLGLDLPQMAFEQLTSDGYQRLVAYAKEHMSGSPEDIGALYYGLLVYYVWYPMCVAWAISEEIEDEPVTETTTEEPVKPPEAVAEVASITRNTEPGFQDRAAIRRAAEKVLREADLLYQDGAWEHAPHIEEDVHQTKEALSQALNPPNPERDFSLPIVNGHTILLTQWITDLQPESNTKTFLTAALQTATNTEAHPNGDVDDVIDIAESLVPDISPEPPEWLDEDATQVWEDLKHAAENDPKSYVAWSLQWFTPAGTDLAYAIRRLEDRWDQFTTTLNDKASGLVGAAPAFREAANDARSVGAVGAFSGAGLGLPFGSAPSGAVVGGVLSVVLSFLVTWLEGNFSSESDDEEHKGEESS